MVIRESKEYLGIIGAYTDDNGRFQYDRFNKELIKLATSSKTIKTVINQGASEEDILLIAIDMFVAKHVKGYSGTEDHNSAMILALDTMGKRRAFTAFKRHLRQMASAHKKLT